MRIFIIFLFLPLIGFSQTFEKLIIHDQQQNPLDIIEIPNGYLLATIHYDNLNKVSFSKLTIIDKKGEEVSFVKLKEDTIDVVKNLYLVNDSSIFVAGYMHSKNSKPLNIVYLLLNTKLEIKNRTEIETNITENEVGSHILNASKLSLNSKQEFIHAFSYLCPDGEQLVGLYLNKVKQDLTGKISMHYPKPDSSGYYRVTCLAPCKGKDSMLLFTTEREDFIINNNLEIVDTLPWEFTRYDHDHGSSGVSSPMEAIWLNNELIIGGGSGNPTLLKYDQNLVMNSYYEFKSDLDEYSAYETPIATNGEYLYLSSTAKYTFLLGVESPLHIIKFNSELEVVWDKYYKENENYYFFAWKTLATSDGGCLIMATRNNSELYGDTVDTYLLKVDSLGCYDTTTNVTLNEVINVALYPNPGKEYFTIVGEYNLINSNFTLYNNLGMVVKNKKLNSSESSFSTTSLIRGLYFYEIRKAGNILHRGKWVKN